MYILLLSYDVLFRYYCSSIIKYNFFGNNMLLKIMLIHFLQHVQLFINNGIDQNLLKITVDINLGLSDSKKSISIKKGINLVNFI